MLIQKGALWDQLNRRAEWRPTSVAAPMNLWEAADHLGIRPVRPRLGLPAHPAVPCGRAYEIIEGPEQYSVCLMLRISFGLRRAKG